VSEQVVLALPFLVAMLLHAFGSRLGAHLHPAAAVRALSGLALVVALATIVELSVAGALVLAQAPWAASLGRWSGRRLRLESDVPGALGACAGIVAGVLMLLTLQRALRAGRELRRAAAAGRALGPAAVVVVDDEVPCAYAIAGRVGRVVISTAMLQVLTPGERRALLAHECAHLDYHHHAFVQAAELAAVNPLLRRTAAAVRAAAERSADEAAVRQVGDRRLVARSLARAARATAATSSRSTVLTATEGAVPVRVRSLLGPAPRRRLISTGAVVLLTGICAASAGLSAEEGHDDIEAAEAAYSLTGAHRDLSRHGGEPALQAGGNRPAHGEVAVSGRLS